MTIALILAAFLSSAQLVSLDAKEMDIPGKQSRNVEVPIIGYALR